MRIVLRDSDRHRLYRPYRIRKRSLGLHESRRENLGCWRRRRKILNHSSSMRRRMIRRNLPDRRILNALRHSRRGRHGRLYRFDALQSDGNHSLILLRRRSGHARKRGRRRQLSCHQFLVLDLNASRGRRRRRRSGNEHDAHHSHARRRRRRSERARRSVSRRLVGKMRNPNGRRRRSVHRHRNPLRGDERFVHAVMKHEERHQYQLRVRRGRLILRRRIRRAPVILEPRRRRGRLKLRNRRKRYPHGRSGGQARKPVRPLRHECRNALRRRRRNFAQ